VDKAVIKYYRRLLRTGFEHAGSLDHPSIFLDTVGEGIRLCGGPTDYLHIFIKVKGNVIVDVKYLCNCDPTANVAVEVMCGLIKGKTLEEASATTVGSFLRVVGRGRELRIKVRDLLELLNRGLIRYQRKNPQPNTRGTTLSAEPLALP
jgi:NifU-like protein involved in Fe-S cluster formation